MTIAKAAVNFLEALRAWILDPVLVQTKTTEAKIMSELDDAVTELQNGISKVADQLVDFKTDFDAALAKLQSGQDQTATVTKLRELSGTLGKMTDSLKSLDTTAEGISGVPTPPAA